MDEENPEVRLSEKNLRTKYDTEIRKVVIMIYLSFLELPWDDSVMHHEQQINKKGGISLSKVQPYDIFDSDM